MGWDIDVKEKIYLRLTNEIFFRIYNGTYQLGAKFPSYVKIAKETGSSPETVRKAFQRLQQYGVIEKTRWGYFVASDNTPILDYRQQYLTGIKHEYLTAKEKVEI